MPTSTRKTSRKAAVVPTTVVEKVIERITTEESEMLAALYSRLLFIQKAAATYVGRPMTSGEFVLASEVYPAATEALAIIREAVNS